MCGWKSQQATKEPSTHAHTSRLKGYKGKEYGFLEGV